jgi:hypothetical protein
MKTIFLFFILTVPAFSQDMAYPTVYEGAVPIAGDLKWHKWSTQNFTILSISETQGNFLANNLEQIKGWCLSRWGIPRDESNVFKFSAECRVFCVPNNELMQKLFKLNQSRVEVKRKSSIIEISTVWLLLDDVPLKTLAIPITEVCLAELSQKYNNKISFCLLRGMCLLNGSIGEIRSNLTVLENIYLSEDIFRTTFDQWEKLPAKNRDIFDKECIILCLLLRKEFGEDKFHQFLSFESRGQSPEDVLKTVYGFTGYKQFDVSFTRYMRDLCSDVVSGKTPDSYLEIKAKKG